MWFNILALAATPSATIIPAPTPIPLVISSLPSQITKGQTFSVTLNIQAKSNQSYQFKVYGGVNGDNYSLEVQNGDNWVNGYNGAWDSLPQVISDADGLASPNLILRFKTDKTSGTCQLIAKIKESNGNTYILSPTYSLDVIDPPPPTSTPTPTVPLPTNTPASTPTPKPTIIPIPTLTIVPTIEPTIEPLPTNIIQSEVEEPKPTGKVLGTSNPSSTNFLPHILVGVGSLFLLVPLLIAKLGG